MDGQGQLLRSVVFFESRLAEGVAHLVLENVEMIDQVESRHLSVEYQNVRNFTDRITQSLSPEDCMVQSMEDASPVRWHLAHTTWFFETFVLKETPGYQEFHPEFAYLFNSYYNAVGDQFPRPQRGTISRPGLEGIREYRKHVDEQLLQRMESQEFCTRWADTIQIGIQHEQQHQELILTDIKHALSANPTLPVFEDAKFDSPSTESKLWVDIPAGVHEVGHTGRGFGFDNEFPQHSVYLQACQISQDLVTADGYLEFINDGGYERPELWLSLGWSRVQQDNWQAPLYWVNRDSQWMQFTFAGLAPVHGDWPVCHLSYFEADAYARWRGCRLPTEFEWEVACSLLVDGNDPSPPSGQFADRLIDGGFAIHPTKTTGSIMGSVWQWTSSSYQAYPGFNVAAGALGEYNGKFMCNQYVLRGGSVATSSSHIRSTYRNFFPAHIRWQFAGLRLAKDC